MRLMYQLFGSAIPMFTNIAMFFYVCRRLLAATTLRRKIMAEMREFTAIVRRARDNVRYIGEQVARGMDEIKEDVGKELRVTDRLTTQSSKLAAVLQRFATLEENVIELVRMERNRESVRIGTPVDVAEEIKRIVAAAERKKNDEWKEDRGIGGWSEESKPNRGRRAVGSIEEDVRRSTSQRNQLSKFSACGPRDTAFAARKIIDGRYRVSTMPEVRLLGEQGRSVCSAPPTDSKS